MSDAAHEVHPGDQDIAEQVETYEAFGKMMKWGSLTIASLVVMLVVWFCVGQGFFAGFSWAVAIAAVGIFFLRERPDAGH